MVRLVLFLLAVLAIAAGLAWLADRPGELIINWQGHEIQTSVFHAIVILTALVGFVIFAWSLARQLWNSPATVGHFINKRRQRRGLDALSSGMIAIGAGDRGSATKYAIQARKSLPNEPLTHLLRAQAAQLSGDRATARRIFEAMLASPDTEQLGLRGLFVEAQREEAREPAQQYAERALRLNPKLAWPVEALFELQCRQNNWSGALETLGAARRNGQIEKSVVDRRRAVLLTAQAQSLEDNDQEKALALSLEAHALAPELVPAAAIAGRILAAKGNTGKAAKVIRRTWTRSPHPELATAYAYARIGDSPRDRLDRIKQLAALNAQAVESPIAVATAAIDARDWDEARHALSSLLDGRLTQRAATLMARIEGEQHGDTGRVREWLARAAHAQRDAAWTADGVVSERWAPVSPVTGALDAFQWKVPAERVIDESETALMERLNELVAMDQAREIDVTPATQPAPTRAAEAPTGTAQPATAVVVEAEPVTAPAAKLQAPNSQPQPTRAPVADPVVAAEPAAVSAAVPEPEPKTVPVTAPVTQTVSAAAPASRPTVAAASSPAASEPRTEPARKPVQEPKIFVPTRPPDDPGAADDDADDYEGPLRPYRAT